MTEDRAGHTMLRSSGCCFKQRQHCSGHKREHSHMHHLPLDSHLMHTQHQTEGKCKAKLCVQQ